MGWSFLFRRGLVFFFREWGNKSFWGCLQIKWNNVRIFHTNLIKMYYCIFSSLTQVVCYDSSYKHLPMKSLPQYVRAFFLSSPFWNVEMIRKLRKFFEFFLENLEKSKYFKISNIYEPWNSLIINFSRKNQVFTWGYPPRKVARCASRPIRLQGFLS